jgi:hypothetical protein
MRHLTKLDCSFMSQLKDVNDMNEAGKFLFPQMDKILDDFMSEIYD